MKIQQELVVDRFHRDLSSPDRIRHLCLLNADRLNFQFPNFSNSKFLYALSGVESSFGRNNVPRYEQAYERGMYSKAAHMQDLLDTYGSIAACSYGPWQILYVAAWELGYREHPLYLWDGYISIIWVLAKLNKIWQGGADTVDKILDAYNSGTHKDKIVPESYINRFWSFYNSLEWDESWKPSS